MSPARLASIALPLSGCKGARWAVIIGLTLAHGAVLAFKLPLLTALPGWFYQGTDKPAGSLGVLLLLVGLVAAVCALLVRPATATWARVLLIVLAGAGFQHGLALTEGRGLDGLRQRTTEAGHSQFFEIAGKVQNPRHVLTRYHALAQEGQLGKYAPTKPPGHLAFYLLNHRLAAVFHRANTVLEQIAWTRTFSSVTWPLLAALAALPLFFLARRLFGDAPRALMSSASYLFVPSFCLVTMHADQALYPLLFLLCALLATWALDRASIPLCLAAGGAAYLSAAVSFPLASAGLLAAPALLHGKTPSTHRKRALLLLSMAAGALAAWLLLRLALSYDPVAHYQRAMTYHGEWQKWEAATALKFAAKNILELLAWLGVPLGALAAERVGRAVLALVRRRPLQRGDLFTLATLAILLAVLGLGRIKAELPRLGLFMMPAFCIISSDMLAGLTVSTPQAAPAARILVIVLQAATAYLTKRYQDFW